MAFGDQIYRQTKITTSKCHECKTRFIKIPLTCHPPFYRKRGTKEAQKRHKTRRKSLFSAIESSMNGGALSITGLGRDLESKTKEKHKIKQ